MMISQKKLVETLRNFTITFFIFLIFRYYFAELLLNNEPNLRKGIILSFCYGLAYLAASNLL